MMDVEQWLTEQYYIKLCHKATNNGNKRKETPYVLKTDKSHINY